MRGLSRSDLETLENVTWVTLEICQFRGFDDESPFSDTDY